MNEKEAMTKFPVQCSSVTLMVRSGARGDMNQIVQLGGMRGQLKDIDGKPLEVPVKRNYREGVSPLEFYIGSHAGRRTMCEKKLLTAMAGDFTRLMVEACYRLTIECEDCKTEEGVLLSPFPAISDEAFEKLPKYSSRLLGRTQMENGEVIDEETATNLSKESNCVKVRSVLTCKAYKTMGYGALCQRCYGWDLSVRDFPELGLPVGILAGQSIGEQGTQSTMRTFHTGGVGGGIITKTEGLPRIKKLLGNGLVDVPIYRVVNPGATELGKATDVDQWTLLIVAGQMPPGGELPSVELLKEERPRLLNLEYAIKEYEFSGLALVIAFEANRIYKAAIHEKHFEVIARAMLRGHDKILRLVGIKSAPSEQPGFLAAASFQRSLEVLARAALAERKDTLHGYKERLMVGKRMREDL